MSSLSLPWSKEYTVFGIPKTFYPYPEKPVYDILAQTAKNLKRTALFRIIIKLPIRK